MRQKLHTKPLCIESTEIAQIAQQGLERALAARHLAELSQEQLNEVSGGKTSPIEIPITKEPIVCGGIRVTYGFLPPENS